MKDNRFDLIIDRKNKEDIINYIGAEDWEKYREFGMALVERIFCDDIRVGIKRLDAEEMLISSNSYLSAFAFVKLDKDNNIIGDNVFAYYTDENDIKRYGPDIEGFKYLSYDDKIEYICNWLDGKTILENRGLHIDTENKKLYKKVKSILSENY